MRQASAQAFSADLSKNPGRYVPGQLPSLPFDDRRFDLVLCSHLLFTYADRLHHDLHRTALLELSRVAAGEARVFPLLDQGGKACDDLVDWLRAEFAASGIASEIRAVPYEFQRGGNRMLVVEGR